MRTSLLSILFSRCWHNQENKCRFLAAIRDKVIRGWARNDNIYGTLGYIN